MTDLKDILKNEGEPNNEDLLKYLQGNATPEERHAIEKQMADSDFVNDAVEGLQGFSDTRKMQQYAAQLRSQLHKQTSRHKHRKNKRRLKDQHWTWIAIIIILVLCLLGYWMIHLYNKKDTTSTATTSAATVFTKR